MRQPLLRFSWMRCGTAFGERKRCIGHPAQLQPLLRASRGAAGSLVTYLLRISDVDALGMKVTYNGGGSSQGRKNFSQDVTDFVNGNDKLPACRY